MSCRWSSASTRSIRERRELTFQVAIRTRSTLVSARRHGVQRGVDPKQARLALIQFALWGIALVAIGGSIAASTWPHTDGLGRYSGDETGFWFGLVIAWIGTLLVLVPGGGVGHEAGTRRLARRRGAPRRSAFARQYHPLGWPPWPPKAPGRRLRRCTCSRPPAPCSHC